MLHNMIRYIIYGIVFLIAYILGLFMPFITYWNRDFIRERSTLLSHFLWLFLNDTKPKDKKDIDAGDYGRFKHNFIGFYMQNAIRNSHWNLKLLLTPKKGIKTDIKGDLTWRRYDLKGWQFATYKIEETKYFRISFSAGWFYFQFGVSDNRYIYKFKINIK